MVEATICRRSQVGGQEKKIPGTFSALEKGKLPSFVLDRLSQAVREPDAEIAVAPLTFEVAEKVSEISRDVVPDVPDRIIGATALQRNLPLVTRDPHSQAAAITTVR